MDIVNSQCDECKEIGKALVIIKIKNKEIKLCDDCMKELIKTVKQFESGNY